VAYLQRSNVAVLEMNNRPAEATPAESTSFGRLKWLWAGLAVLVIASPLGLLAPGMAWGEWGTDQLASLGIKAVPQGMQALSGLWGAPMAGYDLPALGNANLGYILSAIVGIIVVAVMVWLFTVLLTRSSARAGQ